MARGVYRITPDARDWRLSGPHVNDRYRTKDEAIEAGRTWAQGNMPSQLIISLANGQFETEYTYGNDPVSGPA